MSLLLSTLKNQKKVFFFSPNKERLSAYNKSKTEAFYLSIDNPSHELFKSDINYLKEKGYNGIMDYGHARKVNKDLYEIVAFNPRTQIKSATGNLGTFDPNNADIRFAILGEQGATALDKAEEATTRLDNFLVLAKEMEKGNKTPLKSSTDNLVSEAKKYKSAEEFVNKNIDDYVKYTKEYKDWAKGSKNIIEAYHGTPYSFDKFEIGKKQAGAYELDGISFATKKELAEPFSRQYPDWYYDKKKIIDKKYDGIRDIKDKLAKAERQKKIRSVEKIKEEGKELQDRLQKEWEEKKRLAI